jgi:MFS family permease
MSAATPAEAARTARALDALNFFLADVRDGLGPYLAIYLLIVQRWDEASIGAVMAVSGVVAVVSQTPMGALIDGTRFKRGLIILAAGFVTVASLALPVFPEFWPVVVGQVLSGIALSVFAPAVAAITLGIVGPQALARRVGRNEAFNHAGNAVAAAVAGGTAWLFGPVAVFWLMAVMALGSIAATLAIREESIDHEAARGLVAEEHGHLVHHHRPSGLAVVLGSRPLLIFGASVVMFHFANAAMLPLVGQKLSLVAPHLATTLMSVCIVAAQLVMIPVSWWVGASADRLGRKPLFAVALGVLAVRGALYPISDAPAWLLGVQLIDGIGAGIFGALFPIVVADITRGTGHFNVSQGAIATATGIGAALSNAVAGLVIVRWGYDAAFLMLAGVAAAGFALFVATMPETRPDETVLPEATGAV